MPYREVDNAVAIKPKKQDGEGRDEKEEIGKKKKFVAQLVLPG